MKKWMVSAGIGAVLMAGCGVDEESVATPRTPGEIEIVADEASDRKVGEDLKRYMVRNCPGTDDAMPPMREQWGPRMREYVEKGLRGWHAVCGNARTIEVEDRRITMTSGLDSGDDLDAASFSFCNLVQGSDVADFTAGHELLDVSGETIENCGERNAYR